MAPPLAVVGEAARSLPTPFLTKTYQLVDDQSIDDVISWNEDGSTFVVWNPTEFARDLLPKYFKHNNFSSFVRQLNTYGFRKVVPDRWEFSNECFRRGDKRLLCDIQRRKISTTTNTSGSFAPATTVVIPQTPVALVVSPADSGEEQVLSCNSAPAGRESILLADAELIGENERLRNENLQLNKELSEMKSLCNNIYALMSNFGGCSNGNSNNLTAESGVQAVKPLDLLPDKMCVDKADGMEGMATGIVCGGGDKMDGADQEMSARLFGVAIGMKRAREIGQSTAEVDEDLHLRQPGGDVKPEPLDHRNGEEN